MRIVVHGDCEILNPLNTTLSYLQTDVARDKWQQILREEARKALGWWIVVAIVFAILHTHMLPTIRRSHLSTHESSMHLKRLAFLAVTVPEFLFVLPHCFFSLLLSLTFLSLQDQTFVLSVMQTTLGTK
jgi:hypothetical protein